MSGFPWSRLHRALMPCLAATAFLCLIPASAGALDDEECYRCHGLSNFNLRSGEEVRELVVDPAFFETSVHAVLNCRECHSDVSSIPHQDTSLEISCGQNCHQQDKEGKIYSHQKLFWEDYATSAHGPLPEGTISCLFCHPGSSLDIMRRRDLMLEVRHCGSCHRDDPHVRSYFSDFHYLALSQGNRRAPSCPDCHTAHRVLPSDDPDSSVHPEALAVTCGAGTVVSSPAGRCHGELGTEITRGAGMSPLDLPGRNGSLTGWALTFVYWCLLLGLFARVGLGLARRR